LIALVVELISWGFFFSLHTHRLGWTYCLVFGARAGSIGRAYELKVINRTPVLFLNH
jgi:hypothetical protein